MNEVRPKTFFLQGVYYFIKGFLALSKRDRCLLIKLKLRNFQDNSVYQFFLREAELASEIDKEGKSGKRRFKRHIKSCRKKTGFRYEDITDLQRFFPL